MTRSGNCSFTSKMDHTDTNTRRMAHGFRGSIRLLNTKTISCIKANLGIKSKHTSCLLSINNTYDGFVYYHFLQLRLFYWKQLPEMCIWNFLLMLGVEPRIYEVGSDHPANCFTTTNRALKQLMLNIVGNCQYIVDFFSRGLSLRTTFL